MLPYLTPPKSGGLYVIRLSDTHYYGGRAKCFRTRWAVHHRLLIEGKHFNPRVQAVFNQHGRFQPEVVSFLPVEVQRAAEQEWLDRHFDDPNCVNLSRSSDGVHAGYKHSAETCAKHRRPIHTLESREKCRQAAGRRVRHTPHPHTEASRAKLSASLKQAWAREKAAGVKRAGFTGTHSDESRRKISAAKRGKPHPHVGVPKTQEQKEQQAMRSSAWWSSLTPAERDAQVAKHIGRPATKGMTGRKHSAETKRKMSEARKARSLLPPSEGDS